MADADTAAKDAAIKARVVTHMNKDHAGELELYLRAFAGIPASLASAGGPPQIADMTLDAMTIRTASGTSHLVPIEPPLANWGASRVRLVEMAQTALKRLGLSDIRVDAYAPPAGLDIVVFSAISFYFLCAATLSLVTPDSAAWRLLDAVFPFGGAVFYHWLVRAIFIPVVVIHVTESWWMAATRLEKHRVPKWSRVWWLWTISPFFEGFTAFRRFDAVVETEKRKKEAQKH